MISFPIMITLLLALMPIFLLGSFEVTNIRSAKDGQKQRIVIDLDGQKEPSYYVKKAKGEINITLEAKLSTQRAKEFKKILEKTRYVDELDFMILDKEEETIITIFTNKKEKVADEIFALPNPSRVVIDLERAQY